MGIITSYTPRKFEGYEDLPNYAQNVRTYTLTATVAGGYEITLARLTVGMSSRGTQQAYAVFESFTVRGSHAAVVKARFGGCDMEFQAVKNAMNGAGVGFGEVLSIPSEMILRALGAYMQEQNPEITGFALMSQSRR